MKTLQALREEFTKILFPIRCISCAKENTPLCGTCLSSCRRVLDTPALYIHSVFSFKDPLIKKIIHAIKYYHRKDLITPLTRAAALELKSSSFPLLASSFQSSTSSFKLSASSWTLVPIPMPRLRKYLRGYNQAELIAKALSQELSIPVRTDILTRSRTPKRQVQTHTRGERLYNQHNSFATATPPLGMNIILVDDVTTTGATLTEARNTLLKQGAKKVIALTLAH
ncbi:MAG: phosphoribosyltransferase family protein [Candidatus Paceibacterota bacterium]